MKKIVIASFLAILMLMLPISSAVQTNNISEVENTLITDDELPKFFITEKDRLSIQIFVETNFEGEEKTEADNLVNRIISSENEVNLVELAEAMVEYGFQPIPEEELNSVSNIEELNLLLEEYWGFKDGEFITNLFQELIDKIIELIQMRLGWVYELLERGITVFQNGVSLVYDYIKPAILAIAVLVVKVINDILAVPNVISELITELFNLQFEEFIDTMIAFTEMFSQDFIDLLQGIKDLIYNQTIKDYISEVQSFVEWIQSSPWQSPVVVTGTVRRNFASFEGATITVRDQTTTTDSNGNFNFSVEIIPSSDSIPPNKAYGMHNCQITISKDGNILKKTLKLLSYVFSGGEIQWNFYLIKSRSKDTSHRTILERFNQIMDRVYSFFPNFFKNLDVLKFY